MYAFWLFFSLVLIMQNVGKSFPVKNLEGDQISPKYWSGSRNVVECDEAKPLNKNPFLVSISERGSIFPPVKFDSVMLPGYNNENLITCVRIINRDGGSLSGLASIYSGGIGYTYAQVDFLSAPFGGFRFHVEIHFECNPPEIECN